MRRLPPNPFARRRRHSTACRSSARPRSGGVCADLAAPHATNAVRTPPPAPTSRQPLGARLAPYSRPRPCVIIARLDRRLAIGIGAAIGRVDDHLMGGGVARPAPHDVAVSLPHRQLQIVLVGPQQRLPRAAELLDLVEAQPDRLLNPPIRILLQPVARPNEADRRADNELAAPRLLVAGRERALAQQVEFVLVQAAFQPE